jgi:hypothetical protein
MTLMNTDKTQVPVILSEAKNPKESAHIATRGKLRMDSSLRSE